MNVMSSPKLPVINANQKAGVIGLDSFTAPKNSVGLANNLPIVAIMELRGFSRDRGSSQGIAPVDRRCRAAPGPGMIFPHAGQALDKAKPVNPHFGQFTSFSIFNKPVFEIYYRHKCSDVIRAYKPIL